MSESNRKQLLFLPEYFIWNLTTPLLFAEEGNQVVSFTSNIRPLDGFTYYCIFNDSLGTQYVKDSIFENAQLSKCQVPFVSNSTVTALSFRI